MEFQFLRSWRFGNQIGDAGGFGRVVEAVETKSGEVCAAKFVPIEPGADRELLIADSVAIPNVVPVIDRGVVGNEYVMIMPLAAGSLRGYLESKQRSLGLADALPVLIDIARALAGLDGKIVHRDLKPENVLQFNDGWSVADFGISRYAEASTSPETRKYSFTPPYAAPEQWLFERCTPATDIYAFGVMAWELLEGRQPFAGDMDQLRQSHLTTVPALVNTEGRLAGLIQECLYKPANSRPGAANILERLQRLSADQRPSRWSVLSDANNADLQRKAAEHAERSQAEDLRFKRRQMFDSSALTAWESVKSRFVDLLAEYVSSAQIDPHRDGHLRVNLGEARFGLSYPAYAENPEYSSRRIPFDIVGSCVLSVAVKPGSGWSGRNHSLLFADAVVKDEYAWFETAFMNNPFHRQQVGVTDRFNPFSLDLQKEDEVADALNAGISLRQVAWPFTRLNAGDVDDFVERWLTWFALASRGQLREPSQLPELQIEHNWRQGSRD